MADTSPGIPQKRRRNNAQRLAANNQERIENFEQWLDRVMSDSDLREEVLQALRNRASMGNRKSGTSAADELYALLGGNGHQGQQVPAPAVNSVDSDGSRAPVHDTAKPARKPRVTPKVWIPRFLKKLHEVPNITIAARLVGIDPETPRKRMEKDATLQVEVAKAMEIGMDVVEAAALKSAVFGDRRPIMWQGVEVGEEFTFSDRMRELLLRGRRPEVFRDRQDVTISGEVQMKLQTPEQRRLTTVALLQDIPRYPVPRIKQAQARVIDVPAS